MFILTIDIGNRTFGYCLLEFKGGNLNNLYNGFINANTLQFKMIKFAADNIVDKSIEIKYKTEIERTRKLKEYLMKIDVIINENKIDSNNLLVLVEEQKKISEINRVTAAQVIFHFSLKCLSICKVSPVRKNSIAFNENLLHSKFIEKYSSKATAAKKHTEANFAHWLDINKISYTFIGKGMLQHPADAFMQAYSHILMLLNSKS
jgi:hypothetical protein